MDTRGQRQIAASMGLGTHLPVTSMLRQEVQLLLVCPSAYVDSSSPMESFMIIWQVVIEG